MMRITLLLLGLCLLVTPAFALGENTPTPPPPPLTQVDYLDQATTLLLAGNYAEAAETLTRLLEEFPDNAEGYALRGYSYQALARGTLAIDDFTRAIQLIPYEWQFYMARGDAFVASNERENAVNDYGSAIRYNTFALGAYEQLADLYARSDRSQSSIYRSLAAAINSYFMQDFEGATSEITDLLPTIDGHNNLKGIAYYVRALAYSSAGDPERALADATTGMEYDTALHDLYLLRGSVNAELGNLTAASEDYYQRITELEDSTRARVLLANDGIVRMDYGVVAELIIDCPVGSRAHISATDIYSSGVDPLIVILDPQGAPVAGDDDSGTNTGPYDALVNNLRIEQPGTYTMVVSHANGGYTGDISVYYSCRK